MKHLLHLLIFLLILPTAFSQNGSEICNGSDGQLKYYKGFYQRTQYISSSTYNAKMGDPSYTSAFYNITIPFDGTAASRGFYVDACGFYRGSLYLGETGTSSTCSTVTTLDSNTGCSTGSGTRASYGGGIGTGKTYVIEFNTEGQGSATEDGATNLIWSWYYSGPEACEPPEVTDIDYVANSATISFTERDGSAPSGTYEVYLLSEYDETEYVDLPVLGNPTQTVTSSPFTLTHLTPNTNYRLWMSKSCGDGLGSGFATDDASYIDTTDYGATAGGTVCSAIPLRVGVKANPYDQNMHQSASTETNEPTATCQSGAAYQSMWFTFEAPPSGKVKISTDTEKQGSVTDTEIALYAAPSSCSDLTTFGTAIACDANSGVHGDGNLSVIEHTGLTPGETYYIQVLAFEGGSYGIEVLSPPADAPVEAPIIGVDDVALNFDISTATLSSVTSDCTITALKDAWVKFVAPSSGNVLLELITNNNATAYLELYEFISGVYTTLGICAASSIDIGVAQQSTSSSLQFRTLTATTELSPGETYYVRVVQEDGSPFESFDLTASNTTLDISNITNEQFYVYPNPTKSQLFFTQPDQILEARIFDLTGKQHTAGKPTNGTLNISHLVAGIYMLQLETTVGKKVQKIIKQ